MAKEGMMKIQIKSRGNGKVLWEGQAESLKEAIEIAAKQKENLSRADLSRVYLSGANLSGADLSGADLSRANFSEANLFRAYLSGADLPGANLSGTSLDVKIPSISSHQFISEILLRAAKKEAEKDFAARIRMETDQCWECFIKLAKRKRVMAWAKKTLFQWKEFKEKFEKEAR